jgi:hypothetical protein
MNSSDEIRREREAAARGEMPFVHNKIPMRIPAEEDLRKIPNIQTDKDASK